MTDDHSESDEGDEFGVYANAKGDAFWQHGVGAMALGGVAAFYSYTGSLVLGGLFCLPAALFAWAYVEARSLDPTALPAGIETFWQHWVAVGLYFPIAVWAYHIELEVVSLLLIMFAITSLLKLNGNRASS